MTRDESIETAAKLRRAGERGQHPHHLGAFAIDGGCVEIVDFQVGVGPHGVRHRACVLGELGGSQRANRFDPRHAAGRSCAGRVRKAAFQHVAHELLLAVDGQAFLQAQLEPVAAGHAVAGPVVEILVADHCLDLRVVGIGRDRRIGQHIARAEKIQALVLHRPEIEVPHRHDHVAVQVQLQSEAPLVPDDRALEAVLRMFEPRQIRFGRPQLKTGGTPRTRRHMRLAAVQAPGHQCEQVARFRVRIVPGREMAPVRQAALVDQVAVRQQHREAVAIGAQADGVVRQHVGPVRKVGDPAKSARLALREQRIAGCVQTRQLGIRLGPHPGADRQHERVGLPAIERQAGLVDPKFAVFQLAPVQLDREQLQPFAVEPQRRSRRLRRAPHLQLRFDLGRFDRQVEAQRNPLDPERRRPIVGPQHWTSCGGHHGRERLDSTKPS